VQALCEEVPQAFGRNNANTIAINPRPIKYHAPWSANCCWMTKKMTDPRMGPSKVPRPPTKTMKIMYAENWTEKIDCGCMNSVLARVRAPAAPQPKPART
jgi:hypothetical protein